MLYSLNSCLSVYGTFILPENEIETDTNNKQVHRTQWKYVVSWVSVQ